MTTRVFLRWLLVAAIVGVASYPAWAHDRARVIVVPRLWPPPSPPRMIANPSALVIQLDEQGREKSRSCTGALFVNRYGHTFEVGPQAPCDKPF